MEVQDLAVVALFSMRGKVSEAERPQFDWGFFFYWLVATSGGLFAAWLLVPTIALPAGGAGVAVLQGLVLYKRIPKAAQWIVASIIGWLAGVAAILVLVPPGYGVLSGAVIGAFTGAAQWWVLRRHVRWAGWWPAISAGAWAIGLASGLELMPRVLLSGVMAGTLTGIVLDFMLRQPRLAANEGQENGR
jgi:hypothetical protein